MIAEEEIAAKPWQMPRPMRLRTDYGWLISSCSEALFINPPRRATGLPFLNRISVGIDLTRYSVADWGLPSTLTLTILTSGVSRANSSSTGDSFLQGPHQSA